MQEKVKKLLLFNKIAAMTGLREVLAERCKKSGVIPKIIEVMSAYPAPHTKT